MPSGGLLVVETHPVQYHAPVYREFAAMTGEPTVVVYGSDFSVSGGLDREFGKSFAWDVNLCDGYRPVILGKAREARLAGRQFPLWRLVQMVRSLRPSALLLVGYAHPLYHAAFCAGVLTGTPLLFRAETTDHAVGRGALKKMVRRAVLKGWYGFCERILYIGERSRQHYLRFGCSMSKLEFSPYCVDTAHLRADEAARQQLRDAAREALGLEPDTLALLFCGKLSWRKRPDMVLAGAEKLASRLKRRVAALFVGDGEMREEIEAAGREGDGRVEVKVTGFRNQTELSPYYHAADLLVLPSERAETWGLVVNEAMHHGLPCVVSDAVGCVPDLVAAGATGEIFERGSEESLAEALARAVRLVGRAEVRERCRNKVESYSAQRAAAGIAAAYWNVQAG